MKINHKHAFSLIELSIVILIIGILIAGITESRGIIKRFRISTARNLTVSSPVNSIDGLALWLEPTMEKSFLVSETEDGVNLSQWKDINSQTGFNYYAIKTASSEVKYEDSGIANLPSVYFSGTPSDQSYFTLSKTTSTADYTYVKFAEKTKFTVFVVSQANDISGLNRPILYSGPDMSFGWGYGLASGKNSLIGTFSNSSSSSASKIPQISSIIFSATSIIDCGGFGSGNGSVKVYINGTTTINTASQICNMQNTQLKIGGFYDGINEVFAAWNGYISEIIIFSKVLSDTDRITVEQYLSQKYSIGLTS